MPRFTSCCPELTDFDEDVQRFLVISTRTSRYHKHVTVTPALASDAHRRHLSRAAGLLPPTLYQTSPHPLPPAEPRVASLPPPVELRQPISSSYIGQIESRCSMRLSDICLSGTTVAVKNFGSIRERGSLRMVNGITAPQPSRHEHY